MRQPDSFTLLALPAHTLMHVPQGPMPEPGAEPLGQQSNPVCIQRLLCLLLLGSQFVSKVETLLSESPGQRVCPMLGLTARVFHQHCPVVSTWPANACDGRDGL